MMPIKDNRIVENDLQNITETVSVIVPVYNVSSYLNKCIKSICEQDYPYLEIILVDDGSTDNSGKICDSYTAKDKRVKVMWTFST